MGNPADIERAKQGKDVWNKWAKDNPGEIVDFGDDILDTDISEFVFPGVVHFTNTHFSDVTHFNNAQFDGTASFNDMQFNGSAKSVGVKLVVASPVKFMLLSSHPSRLPIDLYGSVQRHSPVTSF
jgi:hypothetical protein